jgi:K+/H+ antiporter YhaU regulatory subunit KhtT
MAGMASLPLWDEKTQLQSRLYLQGRELNQTQSSLGEWQNYADRISKQNQRISAQNDRLSKDNVKKEQSINLADRIINDLLEERFSMTDPDNLQAFGTPCQYLLFHAGAKLVYTYRQNGWEGAWSVQQGRVYNLFLLTAYRNINDLACADVVMHRLAQLNRLYNEEVQANGASAELDKVYHHIIGLMASLANQSNEIRQMNNLYDKSITDLQVLSKTGKLVYANADDVFPTWESLLAAGYLDRGSRELDFAIENISQKEVASRCKIAVERDLQRLLFPKERVGVLKGWMPVISAMTDPPTRVLEQYNAVYNRNNPPSP